MHCKQSGRYTSHYLALRLACRLLGGSYICDRMAGSGRSTRFLQGLQRSLADVSGNATDLSLCRPSAHSCQCQGQGHASLCWRGRCSFPLALGFLGLFVLVFSCVSQLPGNTALCPIRHSTNKEGSETHKLAAGAHKTQPCVHQQDV